jgi:proteasome lid subunit RPN8/RPN11
VRIARDLHEQLVAHALAEAPNECCGLIGTRDGRPATFYPMRNEFNSPMRFRLHGDDMPDAYELAEQRGEELSIVYHSHPRSEAYPSQTDINIAGELAGWFPSGIWVICSLAGDQPVVRAFEIGDAGVEEVELVVG